MGRPPESNRKQDYCSYIVTMRLGRESEAISKREKGQRENHEGTTQRKGRSKRT